MKKLLLAIPVSLVLMVAGCNSPGPASNSNSNTSATPAAAAAIPYSLALEGFTIDGFPGLHSAVVAGDPEKLLMIGGRRNGLHLFPAGHDASKGPSFPKAEANDLIYALDLTKKTLLGTAQVATLPLKVANQFKATNTEYKMLNGWLYIMGGYGADAKTGGLSTLGYVTVVDFEALAKAVINKQPLDAAFAAANIVQFDHPALAITGGELEVLPDTSGGTDFVLAFGQQYDGEYTTSGGLTNQIYSDGVRVFQFTYAANSNKPTGVNFLASVPNPPGTQMDPENPYHRRDFTLKPSVDASGNRRLAAYGGVFKGGRIEGFLNPVFIGSGSKTVTLTANTATAQLMNQYDTAAIQLFDNRAGSQTIYTTFFGGISQYYWDAATNTLKHDALDLGKGIDGLPFINSITTLKMPVGNDTGTQYLHVGQTMPPATPALPSCSTSGAPINAPYGGAECLFVLATGVPQATPGVIQLSSITTTSVAGFMVGGIASTLPYPNDATCACNMFYRVTLNPTQPTSTVELKQP